MSFSEFGDRPRVQCQLRQSGICRAGALRHPAAAAHRPAGLRRLKVRRAEESECSVRCVTVRPPPPRLGTILHCARFLACCAVRPRHFTSHYSNTRYPSHCQDSHQHSNSQILQCVSRNRIRPTRLVMINKRDSWAAYQRSNYKSVVLCEEVEETSSLH